MKPHGLLNTKYVSIYFAQYEPQIKL